MREIHWINAFWKVIAYDATERLGAIPDRKLAFTEVVRSVVGREVHPGHVMSTLQSNWRRLTREQQAAAHSAAVLLYGEDLEKAQQIEPERNNHGIR